MNEETSSQLHVDYTKVQDCLIYHVNCLDEEVNLLKRKLDDQEKRLQALGKRSMDQMLQLVTIQTLLSHYEENRWAPMAKLFKQLGKTSVCGILPDPLPHVDCVANPTIPFPDIFLQYGGVADESPVIVREDGSSSSSSCPFLLLESDSSTELSFKSFEEQANHGPPTTLEP